MIPPKPTQFAVNRAPDWCELKLSAFKTIAGDVWWETRPRITPRLQLVHTNGATREGSIESAVNWGNAAPYSNTHPHYQVDRNRAAKLVPTDRKGIGNATGVVVQAGHGNVSDWSIVIETSDAGYPTPGESGGAIATQVDMIAQILAYESILHAIPLGYPATWYGKGTACHTEPFGYPYWTVYDGKVCPGRTKKQQMREIVLPRAVEIANAWTGSTPVPTPIPPEDHMAHKVIVEDARQGGAHFTLDYLPISGEVEAELLAQGYKVKRQDHPYWTAACQQANGGAVAVLYEKFRDSRDGVAD
jgi:hypothetical protein